MTIRLRIGALALALAAAAAVATAAPAQAQGNGNGKGGGKGGHSANHAKDGRKGKKPVTTDDALSVTRTVLVQKGYEVVRVERVGVTQVVYYRRGNMGRGRGKGPVERMVIRPRENYVVFDDGDPDVLVSIRLKLDL